MMHNKNDKNAKRQNNTQSNWQLVAIFIFIPVNSIIINFMHFSLFHEITRLGEALVLRKRETSKKK